MKLARKTIQVVIWSSILLLSTVAVYAQKNPEHAAASAPAPVATSQPIRLKLVDGSSITVDEAWESEQGIWYRQGGMSHLVARDRVKAVERGVASKPRQKYQTESQLNNAGAIENQDEDAKAAAGDGISGNSGISDQPVWIYLVGGARVEADSVTESAAGAWYRRGSLSVFIERARIDHIERELETVADSDSSSKKARGWTTGNAKIDSLIKQNGARHGVDPYLIFCVMEQESHFNARALSPKGARGLMQLMPGTAARFGIRRPSDPAQNIAGGTRYLKQLMGQFNGRIDLVLASYNAGEGAVMKFGNRVPPYRETRDYVKRISFRYGRTKKAPPPKSEAPAVGATL